MVVVVAVAEGVVEAAILMAERRGEGTMPGVERGTTAAITLTKATPTRTATTAIKVEASTTSTTKVAADTKVGVAEAAVQTSKVADTKVGVAAAAAVEATAAVAVTAAAVAKVVTVMTIAVAMLVEVELRGVDITRVHVEEQVLCREDVAGAQPSQIKAVGTSCLSCRLLLTAVREFASSLGSPSRTVSLPLLSCRARSRIRAGNTCAIATECGDLTGCGS